MFFSRNRSITCPFCKRRSAAKLYACNKTAPGPAVARRCQYRSTDWTAWLVKSIRCTSPELCWFSSRYTRARCETCAQLITDFSPSRLANVSVNIATEQAKQLMGNKDPFTPTLQSGLQVENLPHGCATHREARLPLKVSNKWFMPTARTSRSWVDRRDTVVSSTKAIHKINIPNKYVAWQQPCWRERRKMSLDRSHAKRPPEVTDAGAISPQQIRKKMLTRQTPCSNVVLKKRMVTGADVAIVGTHEQARFASPEVGHVDVAFPYRTRRQAARLQLEPLVTNDHCHGVRSWHVNLSSQMRRCVQ